MRIQTISLRPLLSLSLAIALALPLSAAAAAQAVPAVRYVLQIDWEAHAVERLTGLADAIEETLTKEPAIAFTGLSDAERIIADLFVEVRITDAADIDEARARLEALREVAETDASIFAFDIDIAENEPGIFRLAFARNGAEAELDALAEATAEIIRGRLTEIGIKPLIALAPDGVINLAVETDGGNILTAIVTQRAMVTFRLVEMSFSWDDPPPLRPGALVFDDALDTNTGYVVGESLMGGDHIGRATAGTHEMTGAEVIGFGLDPEGAALFGEITGANIGRQLAIAIDNVVLTAPTIQEAITGGEVIITGAFGAAEAAIVAALIGNGPFPAPIILLEETVGGDR